MEVVTLLVASILVVLTCAWFWRSDPRLPPSPARPLPLVGHLFYMKMDARLQFKKWRKQCGDIFSLNIAGTLVVVLNGYEVLKEALVQKADFFNHRPSMYLDEASGIPGKGIGLISGNYWKEQRSVITSILRTFGMGKNILAEKIQEEVNYFTEYLASLQGKATDIQSMVFVSVSNVICSILFGKRFNYEDTDFQNIMEHINSLNRNVQAGGLINFIPWLRLLPGDLFKAKIISTNLKALINAVSRYSEHKVPTDINDIDNFADAYIYEKNKRHKEGTATTMDEDSLKRIMFELFSAGTDTTSSTINWAVLFLINYPDVQENVFREIKKVIGTVRVPTIQDKPELPYMNAFIMETQRLANVVPLALPHMCPEEVTLRGYTLPKGTYIIPNLDSVLHDKTIWGDDVMSFRPERFIDDNGKLKNPEQFIPFGAGRRACLGEAIARMELFLFLATSVQKFQFLPVDPGSPPSTGYVFGIVTSPKNYQLRVLEREQL